MSEMTAALKRGAMYDAAREAWDDLARAYNDPHPVTREDSLPGAIGRARLALEHLAEANIALRHERVAPSGQEQKP